MADQPHDSSTHASIAYIRQMRRMGVEQLRHALWRERQQRLGELVEACIIELTVGNTKQRREVHFRRCLGCRTRGRAARAAWTRRRNSRNSSSSSHQREGEEAKEADP